VIVLGDEVSRPDWGQITGDKMINCTTLTYKEHIQDKIDLEYCYEYAHCPWCGQEWDKRKIVAQLELEEYNHDEI
jgi:hypothetical protein